MDKRGCRGPADRAKYGRRKGRRIGYGPAHSTVRHPVEWQG